MKKKGFTLLELLAVIIILAVIALIATPVVLNVVDEAKKSAFQDSSYGLIKSGEYYYTSQILNGGMTSDKVFNFPNNTELEFSGTEPKSGYIKVTKDGLVEIAISDGKYCATKGINDETVTITDYVEGECTVGNETLVQLQAPTISLNGDILNITSNDDNEEEYEIYVDGDLMTTISANSNNVDAPITVNKIKGIWTFNETITIPEDWYLSEFLDFKVNFSSLEYGEGILSSGRLVVSSSSSSSTMYYYITYANPDNAFTIPSQISVYSDVSDGWYLDKYGEEIKTITFLEEQEVSEKFYNWFTTNATELKEINGVWKFKDEIDTSGNVPVQNINYTVKTIPPSLGTEVTLHCYSFGVGDPDIVYSYNSMIPDIGYPQTGYFYTHSNDGWNVEDFGEGIKTIDFGAESQLVPLSFYNWLKDNAEKKTLEFNLESLNLSAGNHVIKLRAKATNYITSLETNNLEYNVESLLVGTWKLNNTLTFPQNLISEDIIFNTIITTNGVKQNAICTSFVQENNYLIRYVVNNLEPNELNLESGTALKVYENSWYNEYGQDVKTITFIGEQKVSNEFYNWFMINAVKQKKQLVNS